MSDISERITQLLGDPQTMEQIKALSGLIGQGAPESAPEPEPEEPAPSGASQMLPMAMKLMPLLGSFNQDDDAIKLLYAIKPFLSPPRREKLEQAIKLLRIIRIVPLLKSEGLLELF